MHSQLKQSELKAAQNQKERAKQQKEKLGNTLSELLQSQKYSYV